MKWLRSDFLIEVYKKALEIDADQDFVEQLKAELYRRNIYIFKIHTNQDDGNSHQRY